MTAGPGAVDRRKRQVVVYPAWSENPYLTLIYLATIARGHPFHGTVGLDELIDHLGTCGPDDVLHLHWTAPVCQAVADAAEARRRLDRFVAAVEEFRAAGGRLLWTIHNRLPHDVHHPELEVELQGFLARAADRVHVMSPSTVELVSDVCTVDPDRVVMVPHPSYQGLYADRLGDRERAREALGVPPDRRAVLFFGQLRPYKGLQHLFDALASMVEDDQEVPVLLLAGRPVGMSLDEITAALPTGIEVVRDHRHIPDSEVASWFSAADLAVFPYTAILNSGSIHLAATMGVPVVAPGETHLREQFVGEEWIRFYEPTRPAEGIAAILRDPASYDAPKVQMRRFSDRLAPWRVSRQMADLIDSL